jgi:hypothetical protein
MYLDAAYSGYQGCLCERGTYGSAPNCLDIPSTASASVAVTNNNMLVFSPASYGDRRQMVGMDTAWLLSPPTGNQPFPIIQ